MNAAGGWTLVDAECDGVAKDTADVTMTVVAGENQTCTLTNHLTPTGAISLSKVTEGGAGTTAFVIEPTGSDPEQYLQHATTTEPGRTADAVPNDATDETNHVYPRTYRIIEQPPLNRIAGQWTLTSVNCDASTSPSPTGAPSSPSPAAIPTPSVGSRTRSSRDDRPRAERARNRHPADHRATAAQPHRARDPRRGRHDRTPAGPGGRRRNHRAARLETGCRQLLGRPLRHHPPAHRRGEEPRPDHRPGHREERRPNDAENVVVDYQAPKAAQLLNVDPPRGGCSGGLPSTCRLGVLKPHQTVEFKMVMSTTIPTSNFSTHTTVGSSTYDPRLTDNTEDERLLVEPLPSPPPTHFVPCRLSAVAHASC
ncbi:MAG: hypothetical protein JST08_08940 [Actinobacteria bacterium]|nr:hypothetical protein [Actinomycetota bacterium]